MIYTENINNVKYSQKRDRQKTQMIPKERVHIRLPADQK